MTVSEGQVIKGTLDCAPNKSNPRDLDIIIDYESEGAEGGEAQKASVQYKMYVLGPTLSFVSSPGR